MIKHDGKPTIVWPPKRTPKEADDKRSERVVRQQGDHR